MRRRALNKWQYTVRMETSTNSTIVPYTVKLQYNHPKSIGYKTVELRGDNSYTFQNIPQGEQTITVSGVGVFNNTGSITIKEEGQVISVPVHIGSVNFNISIYPAEKQEYSQSTGVTNTTYLPTYATISYIDATGNSVQITTDTSSSSNSYSNKVLVNSYIEVMVYDDTSGKALGYSYRIGESSRSFSAQGQIYSITVS